MANLSNINNKFLVTTTGEVLIGQTANNGNRLQITGADGASYIYLKTDVATTGGSIGFISDDLRVFNQQASGDLSLGTVGAERMRIASDGSVRIGKSTNYSMSSPYLMIGNSANTNELLLSNQGSTQLGGFDGSVIMSTGGSNNLLISSDNGYLAFGYGVINGYTSYNEAMRITSGGNVGIGTTVTNGKLSIAANDATTTPPISSGIYVGPYQGNTAVGSAWSYSNSAGTYTDFSSRYNSDASYMRFVMKASATPVYAMTIRGGGNIGIGTDSPDALLNLSQANGANIRFDNETTEKYFTIGEGVGTNNVFSFRGNSYRSTDTLSIDFVNDRVGIGTISPNKELTLGGAAGTQTLSFTTSAYLGDQAVIGNIEFSTHNADASYKQLANIYALKTGTNTNSGDITFWTKRNGARSEKIRIENDGTLRIKEGSIIIDGTSQGIYLGGTAAANNLNYYASGTWTPTVTTSQLTSPTITSSSGRWQRVGKVVTASFEFTMSNPTVGAGSVIINNLPIAFADNQHVSGCGVIGDLGKTINVRYYTGNNQIAMNFYDGNYCGTAFRTVGTVTYWAAT